MKHTVDEKEIGDLSDIRSDIILAKQHLQKGQFNKSITISDEVLSRQPKHIEALYVKAVAQRYNTQYADARETLKLLKSAKPEYGRAFQEDGHVFRALGDHDKALQAYMKATLFNPGLEASWKAQADILIRLGRVIEAKNASGFYDRLKALPRELHIVTNYIYEDELEKAEILCKRYMQGDKQNVEGMRLLAEIANRMRADDEAMFLYETALALEPNNVTIGLDYINFLKKIQQIKKSYSHAVKLNDTYPNTPMLQFTLAVQCLEVGEHEKALSLLDKVIEQTPNDPTIRTLRGHALKTSGRQKEAIESYRMAFAVKPSHSESFFSLANLKTYKFLDSEIKHMEDLIELDDLTLKDQANFHFSLGKSYEDKKNFSESFAHYEQGNTANRTLMRYDADRMTKQIQKQIEVCTPELFLEKSGMGYDAPDPIFILGLPRAGSTLLEQIIASHSQIDGTLELPNILILSSQLSRKSSKNNAIYPQIMHDLTAKQLNDFGKAFIEDTRIHRQGAPFFIDKMPNNFRHIGLIHLILPNAKIIDARRHPMACCFSGFKQHFAEGQEFTYGLTQIGQYYRDYVELMDHWDKVLPNKILRVQYEDVVADTETQVRRILEYLDLPFEEACVEFHKTERSVRTASSEQVRQPIFKSGLEQWRNFEPWLDPLKEALGPVLDRYPI